MPCLSLLHYIVQFSRFDLPTAFAARFEDLSYARSSNPTTNVTGMVGPSGLEPPTLRLSVVRSSQLSYGPVVDTSSISLAALQAVHLAHFAASPLPRRPASLGSARILDDWLLYCFLGSRKSVCFCGMVEIVGIEPATSCLQGRRSPS